MKSKFTTFILFLILIILTMGIIVFGGAIYADLMGLDTDQIILKLDTIATENPNDEKKQNSENSIKAVNQSIQSILDNNSKSEQIETGYVEDDSNISKYFYGQLSNNQVIIYNKLMENKQNLKQGNYVIKFGNTFSEMLSKEGGSEMLGRDYQTAIEAFIHDNPELFYIDVNKMYINIKTTTKFFTTTYDVYISAAQDSTYLSDEFNSIEQINEAIEKIEKVKNNIITNLPDGDYNKILAIHNYLIENVEYDSTYNARGTYSIYGALIGKTCVCEGYSKALKYLLNAAGIECEIMQGTATNSSGTTESHAWNCVKIYGKWYEIDATWDDPIIIGSGIVTNSIKYKYFLKGKNTFNKDHILSYQFSEGGKYFSYPDINETDY